MTDLQRKVLGLVADAHESRMRLPRVRDRLGAEHPPQAVYAAVAALVARRHLTYTGRSSTVAITADGLAAIHREGASPRPLPT